MPYAALELVCRDFGNASIRHTDADWAKPQFGKYQHDLAMNGVDLIQIQRFGIQQKNAADIRMAVDAMKTLITHPDIGTYLLVAATATTHRSCSDCVSSASTSSASAPDASASPRLVSVCSEYKYWGTLVTADEPSAKPTVEKTFDIKHGEELMIRAIKQSNTPTPVAAWLKARMLTLDSAFDQRNYGCRNFKEFLGQLSDVVVLEGGDRSGHLRVRLSGDAPSPQGSAH
ncbi:NYN domain-containing protein [Amycolatopsis sp. Hca4]|uniref:NYN domain-containing protein n=1 Tax=Amycolatopsis sp. Hca4 TaxID=2742131 RepID=UPI001C37BF42|nr:NYN domain-containing protein [Amycolatopsis sp. Hca4]